jgi:hypothetical protein
MQSIPRLKVITDKVTDAARDIGISVDQLLGTEEVPVADVAWQYAPGKLWSDLSRSASINTNVKIA